MTEISHKPIEAQFTEKLEKLFKIKDGGMIEVNPGRILVPPKFLEVAQRIQDLEVRPDDVWVVSYPRTGSTWTQEMVWCIGNDMDMERAKMPQHLRCPLLELSALMGNDTCGIGKIMGDTVSIVENHPSPRYIKTHLPAELLPKQLQVVKPKVIYVCRNPKDMCVSYYHYCRLLHDMDGAFSDFCDLFLQDKVPMGPIWNHILGFWALRNEPNIMFIRFGELKKDLRGVATRVAKFMNKELSEENMKILLEHLSFANMKRNPAVNLEPVLEYRKANMAVEQLAINEKAPEFIRKGVIGDWANHMTPEMADRFDAWIKKNLEGTGLQFE